VPQFSVGGYTLALSHLGLGHIISDNFDDKSEILSKRNSLCSNINNVLCYFYKQNPVGAYKKSYPGYSGTNLRPHSTSLPSKLGFVTPCQKCTADCLRPNGTRHNGSLYWQWQPMGTYQRYHRRPLGTPLPPSDTTKACPTPIMPTTRGALLHPNLGKPKLKFKLVAKP